jgi:hypothetical protein
VKPLAIAVLLLCGCSTAWCADFCAVRVLVMGWSGSPAPALVELRNARGETVDRSLAPKGVAEFCDFDFGLYSIAVGGTTCGAAVIPDIRLRFGVTQVYRVYLNRCSVWDSIPAGCSIYFRIADEQHRPLGGAMLTSTGTGGKATADSYGRMEITIPEGTTRKFEFTKEGYRPASLQYACEKTAYEERPIVMSPSPR